MSTPQPPPSQGSISEIELATRAGTTTGTIRQFVELGIVAPSAEGGFRPTDLLRVRVALALEESGVSMQDIGLAIAAGHLSMAFAETTMAEPVGLLPLSHRQLQEELGLSDDQVSRFQEAIGFLPTSPDAPIREDDAELLRSGALLREMGVSDDRVIRGIRVFVDHLRPIALFERELWKGDVEGPAFDRGLTEHQMLQMTAQLRIQMQRMGDRTMLLLHRRLLEELVFQNMVEHVEAAMEQAGIRRRQAAMDPAIGFLDLAGYTRLTDEIGDEAAAGMAVRLGEMVRRVPLPRGARPVKFLGDGVMFHFPNPAGSVSYAVDLVRAAPEVGLPPARVGLSAGPVVSRDGDFFGRTVNLASRVVARAEPGEVLLTEELRNVTGPEARLEFLGPTELKGLAEPVALYRVRMDTGPGV